MIKNGALACKYCIYWDNNMGENYGECFRFPPRQVNHGEPASFPRVSGDDYCAEMQDDNDSNEWPLAMRLKRACDLLRGILNRDGNVDPQYLGVIKRFVGENE